MGATATSKPSAAVLSMDVGAVIALARAQATPTAVELAARSAADQGTVGITQTELSGRMILQNATATLQLSAASVAALEAGTLMRGRRTLAAALVACGLANSWRPAVMPPNATSTG